MTTMNYEQKVPPGGHMRISYYEDKTFFVIAFGIQLGSRLIIAVEGQAGLV